jgi:hypothetical protein
MRLCTRIIGSPISRRQVAKVWRSACKLSAGLRDLSRGSTAWLRLPYCSPSALAHTLLDCVAAQLPGRQMRALGDGGYATKEFRRELPPTIHVRSRALITGKLYGWPPHPLTGAVVVARRQGACSAPPNPCIRPTTPGAPSHGGRRRGPSLGGPLPDSPAGASGACGRGPSPPCRPR